METRLFAGYWWGKGEPLVICSSDADASIRNITLRNAAIRAENSIVVSGTAGSVTGVRLENLDVELSYGTRRLWCGGKIDLCPNPCKPAPDATIAIPWLWSDGASQIEFTHVTVSRRRGESVAFDTREIIL